MFDTTNDNDDDGSNHNNDSMLLTKKIEILIQSSKQNDTIRNSSAVRTEQLLVALVLLSRVQNDNEFIRLMMMIMESCGDTVHWIVSTKST